MRGSFAGKIFTHWQERRKVEDAYVAGLQKLAKRPLAEVGQDLGYVHGIGVLDES